MEGHGLLVPGLYYSSIYSIATVHKACVQVLLHSHRATHYYLIIHSDFFRFYLFLSKKKVIVINKVAMR